MRTMGEYRPVKKRQFPSMLLLLLVFLGVVVLGLNRSEALVDATLKTKPKVVKIDPHDDHPTHLEREYLNLMITRSTEGKK